ncbi:hypothetical protein [Bradyrhizobium sp. Rc2d]|nr:hypothetical protein [Bradyrhizobium sp. Rc2d]
MASEVDVLLYCEAPGRQSETHGQNQSTDYAIEVSDHENVDPEKADTLN